VRSFALALGVDSPPPNLARYDLVVVDGVGTTAAQVAGLRRRGVRVLGYLSVGTIERGRPWTSAATPFRLGHWGDWNEWYADVSRVGFRRVITRRALPRLMAKRFDGVFLDNVDMIETHPRQAIGMRVLVREIAASVHRRGGVVFVQNGDSVIDGFVPFIDGWNREDVTTRYDFERRAYLPARPADTRRAVATIRRLARRGLVVTTTDYTRSAGATTARRARAVSCAAGAVPFVSDIGLTRVPPPVPCR